MKFQYYIFRLKFNWVESFNFNFEMESFNRQRCKNFIVNLASLTNNNPTIAMTAI
jgi:hypothetical protein